MNENKNLKFRSFQKNHHFLINKMNKTSNEFSKNISKKRPKSGKNNFHLIKVNEKVPNNFQNAFQVDNLKMIKSVDFPKKDLEIRKNHLFRSEEKINLKKNKNRIIDNKIKELQNQIEDQNQLNKKKFNNFRYGAALSSIMKNKNVIPKENNIFPKNIINNHNSNNEKKKKIL